jgi:(S)-mandelate dehydrogenase
MKAIVTVDDLRLRAKKHLPRILFDWIEGGAGDEAALRDNEDAISRVRFLPRYMIDVTQRSQSKTLFGRTYDSPFGIAPTGYAGVFRPQADTILAGAAKRANLPFILSGTSVDSIETVMQAAPEHAWYQLYGAADPQITTDMIRRADRAGCAALVITIDIPVAARRERDLRNGFAIPLALTPRLLLDGMMHPAWAVRYLANGGMPVMENWRPYAPSGANAMEVAQFANTHSYCVQTWDHLKLFRDLWPRKLVVKGVSHPEDAAIAVELGADGIIASNHGGRQSDRLAAVPHVIPLLRDAVGAKFPLMIDGGIRRGTDVLAALCVGADFVFAGRAPLYGAVASGEKGADRALDILREELDAIMGQIGCLSLEDTDLQRFVLAQ